MKEMKVLALGAAALTAGTLLMSGIALADGYSHRAAPDARWLRGSRWSLANAGALNTDPSYGYFTSYSYAYPWPAAAFTSSRPR
jgi:hypothetical protein